MTRNARRCKHFSVSKTYFTRKWRHNLLQNVLYCNSIEKYVEKKYSDVSTVSLPSSSIPFIHCIACFPTNDCIEYTGDPLSLYIALYQCLTQVMTSPHIIMGTAYLISFQCFYSIRSYRKDATLDSVAWADRWPSTWRCLAVNWHSAGWKIVIFTSRAGNHRLSIWTSFHSQELFVHHTMPVTPVYMPN